MKKKRHTAAWSRQQRKLLAKRNGGIKPAISSVHDSIEAPLPRVDQREVNVDVDGQTVAAWLDGYTADATVPEATSSEILAQNRQDASMNQESKPQREATGRMRRGKQTPRGSDDKPLTKK